MANQLQGDKWLLQFNNYEEYLNWLVTQQDLYFLRSWVTARIVAELGYRSSGETLSQEKFVQRLEAVRLTLCPAKLDQKMCSHLAQITDPLLLALAARERANREGLLATIIFVRLRKRTGHEVSGYVDYAHRITTESWLNVFRGRRKIWPQRTDLGYFHWRSGVTYTNSSPNFTVVPDPRRGLMYQNTCDHKLVNVNPKLASPGEDTVRTRITTPMYLQAVLYDHIVRRKG